jgi:hypothetical protein
MLLTGRIHSAEGLLFGKAIRAVRDHMRVHERRHPREVPVGDCVARRPQSAIRPIVPS